MDKFRFEEPSIREVEDFLTAKCGKEIRLGGNYFDPQTLERKTRIIIQGCETGYFLFQEKAADEALRQQDANAYYDTVLDQVNKTLILFDEEMKSRKGKTIEFLEGLYKNEKNIN